MCFVFSLVVSFCFEVFLGLVTDEIGIVVFFFQAEDGIRDLVRSRGLGDVYKRQTLDRWWPARCTAASSKSA